MEMRTLFIVPKMFTSNELSAVNSTVPEDFPQKSKEFWDYIDEKLRNRSIQKLYYDSLTIDEPGKALEFVKKSNEDCYNLVRRFNEAGAKIEITEDPLLVQEAAAWISMLQNDKTDLATQEMLAKNMIDRDKYIGGRISESLRDGETGILFLAPGRQISEYVSSDIRVVKVQPFDPSDYLNSWLVTLSLRSQVERPASEKN
jgi:hypothetical protein